ncbi:MAG: M67 family metallopeptidase [Firmicutes bacterium]|nr:M67 family metallopeptidase [Bacillota bacterium]
MIILDRDTYEAILAHCCEEYPHEACGLLVGRAEQDGAKRLVRAERARNLNTERAHDRYELDPQDFLRVDRSLDGTGYAIAGVYHSHPDHPARPSAFDTERAWPGVSYLLVSVARGRPAEARSWVLDEGTQTFREEPIRIEQG